MTKVNIVVSGTYMTPSLWKGIKFSTSFWSINFQSIALFAAKSTSVFSFLFKNILKTPFGKPDNVTSLASGLHNLTKKVNNILSELQPVAHWIELLPQSKMKPEIMNFRRPNSKESIHHANHREVLFGWLCILMVRRSVFVRNFLCCEPIRTPMRSSFLAVCFPEVH